MPLWTIKQKDADQRIDVALAKHTETTRSQIQKLIRSGTITLNQKKVSPHAIIENGDVVFYPELLTHLPFAKTGPAPLLDILYQDKDVMIINKPAGLLVHQTGPQDADPTVVDTLLEAHPSSADVGDDPARPGVVHRLDRDVSGVLILAKTQPAFDYLKHQFQEHKIEKEYLALVYGQMEKTHGMINFKIARSRTLGRMVARPTEQDGKEACTEYDVLERYKTVTYVRVKTHTGRTHQIRAHFKAINHPLVGDKLYKKPHMKNISPIELDRIFLHAHELTLTLPNNQRKTFVVPLPEDLRALLNKLPRV